MNEQNEPAMEQHEVTTQEQIDGLLAQVRADVGDRSLDRIREVLTQRLAQSGIAVDDARIAELAQQVRVGED